jgi:peptidoglycan/LPS O-acetylase OafA/YrhL
MNPKRIPQLDGLRGVAIALVLTYHYLAFANTFGAPRFFRPLFWVFSLGWSGVDLFFVLSGFLIGGILLDARGSSNYFRVFYTRRVCRIFPLYFAFLALAFFASRFSPLRLPWHWYLLFAQNFWMAAHQSLGSSSIFPTWSLAVEEQFYLLLPALIYFVKPSRLPWFLGAGIVLAPLIRAAIYLKDPASIFPAYVLLPCRMNALLMGVAAAYLFRQPEIWNAIRSRRRQLWLALEVLTGLSVFLLFHPTVDEPLERLAGFDFFAVLYTVILVLSLTDDGLGKALRNRWLVGLGGIAYCVYLIQQPIFELMRRLVGAHDGVLTATLALPVIIIIAKISWKWFERPFVQLGHQAHYHARRESESPRIAPIAAAEARP